MSNRLLKADIVHGCTVQVRPYQGKRFLIVTAQTNSPTIRTNELELLEDKTYTIKINGNDLFLFEKDKGGFEPL